jgi:hypothetical protein
MKVYRERKKKKGGGRKRRRGWGLELEEAEDGLSSTKVHGLGG